MDREKDGQAKHAAFPAGAQVQTTSGDEVVKPDGTREWTLPSGRKATCKRGTGETILRAQRMVGTDELKRDPLLMVFGMIACKCTVDGRELTVEQVRRELEDLDVFDLMNRVQGNRGKSSPPIISQP